MSPGALHERIWQRDVTVWAPAGTPEVADRLGWLDLPTTMPDVLDDLTALAAEVAGDTDRIILCGMGGASLAPEVLYRGMPRAAGRPALHLLDTTHPDAIGAVLTPDGELGPGDLVLVASKSGTTIETASLLEFFWARSGQDGGRFMAVTDPGTPLARLADERGFRRVFLNPPDIGGRFSGLSLFGLVPAALCGVDVAELLARARLAAEACRLEPRANFWLRLGLRMGEAAAAGRDKLTFLLAPGIEALGLWLEQLIAESTGKGGRGMLPVVGERTRAPERYGADRLFVRIGVLGDPMPEDDLDLMDLDHGGLPVLRTDLDDPPDLGAQFFGWEFATAVAGHLLGVNPFDQPNVAEAKQRTSEVLAGDTAVEVPQGGAADLDRLLDGVAPGDYVAVTAFAPVHADRERTLAALQAAIGERTGVPVTTGFGPRYLHSTGQLHKGGPPTGHVLQIVDPVRADLDVPGAGHTFGALIGAQADGDYAALAARGRPVVRLTGWDIVETLFS